MNRITLSKTIPENVSLTVCIGCNHTPVLYNVMYENTNEIINHYLECRCGMYTPVAHTIEEVVHRWNINNTPTE